MSLAIHEGDVMVGNTLNVVELIEDVVGVVVVEVVVVVVPDLHPELL